MTDKTQATAGGSAARFEQRRLELLPRLMKTICRVGERCACADNNHQWRDRDCDVIEHHCKAMAAMLAAAPSQPPSPHLDDATVEACAEVAANWHPMLYAPEMGGSHPRDSAYMNAKREIALAIRSIKGGAMVELQAPRLSDLEHQLRAAAEHWRKCLLKEHWQPRRSHIEDARNIFTMAADYLALGPATIQAKEKG